MILICLILCTCEINSSECFITTKSRKSKQSSHVITLIILLNIDRKSKCELRNLRVALTLFLLVLLFLAACLVTYCMVVHTCFNTKNVFTDFFNINQVKKIFRILLISSNWKLKRCQ